MKNPFKIKLTYGWSLFVGLIFFLIGMVCGLIGWNFFIVLVDPSSTIIPVELKLFLIFSVFAVYFLALVKRISDETDNV